MNPYLSVGAAVLIVWTSLACSPTTTERRSSIVKPSIKADAEQRLVEIKKAMGRDQEYATKLAAEVKQEKRNDQWAVRKEAELKKSYLAANGVPRNGLKSIECRSTKCAVQAELSPEQAPKTIPEQQNAINKWISDSQPCAYTITAPPAGTVQIFLACKE